MNKKLVFAVSAVVGIGSLFLPWFEIFDMGQNAFSEEFKDGYVLIFIYGAILFLALAEKLPEKLQQKRELLIKILAIICLVVSVGEIVVNQDLLDQGVSVGMGTILSIVVSGVIVVYSLYTKNLGVDRKMPFTDTRCVRDEQFKESKEVQKNPRPKFCSKCGEPVKGESGIFCAKCGAKLK